MTLTLRQLLDAWGTPQGASFEPDALVGRVCTDSRQLQAGDFFVPLVGERFDGLEPHFKMLTVWCYDRSGKLKIWDLL